MSKKVLFVLGSLILSSVASADTYYTGFWCVGVIPIDYVIYGDREASKEFYYYTDYYGQNTHLKGKFSKGRAVVLHGRTRQVVKLNLAKSSAGLLSINHGQGMYESSGSGPEVRFTFERDGYGVLEIGGNTHECKAISGTDSGPGFSGFPGFPATVNVN